MLFIYVYSLWVIYKDILEKIICGISIYIFYFYCKKFLNFLFWFYKGYGLEVNEYGD